MGYLVYSIEIDNGSLLLYIIIISNCCLQILKMCSQPNNIDYDKIN